jgi:hypothetical protein
MTRGRRGANVIDSRRTVSFSGAGSVGVRGSSPLSSTHRSPEIWGMQGTAEQTDQDHVSQMSVKRGDTRPQQPSFPGAPWHDAAQGHGAAAAF